MDVIGLQIFAAAGGLYEHGPKLVDLIRRCGHDFGSFDSLTMPEPPKPGEFDPDGRYHAIRTDEWGTTWEYRIFGIWGHPIAWPLADAAKIATYRPPPPPPVQGADFDKARADAAEHMKKWFLLAGTTSLFERMFSLRPFEDVVADVYLDTPQINRLADLLAEHSAEHVRRALALGADAVAVGDDFGTQQAPFFPPEVFRRFFKRRYEQIFEPIRQAGKKIFFHSCGQIAPILEDLAEIGVSAVWPQLPIFDLPELARRCRRLRLAVQLHPDRGELMQRKGPADVRNYVLRLLDIFDTAGGGSWLYLEVDPGFPWANVRALFDVAMELRGQKG